MKKIRIWREYNGNRCDWVIPVGDYYSNDEALFGLEKNLVDNGNAVWIEREEPKVELPMDNIVDAVKTEEEVTEAPKPKRGRRSKS